MHDLKAELEKILEHLRTEFSGLQVGRANPLILEEVIVEAYGTQTPLKAVATITCPDPQTLRVEPWDKSQISAVEKGILESNVGLKPQNMGEHLLLPIPPMTEERRKQMVKQAREETENARISVRNVRQEFLKKVKAENDEKLISDDEAEKREKDIQKQIDEVNTQIGEMAEKKEADILKV